MSLDRTTFRLRGHELNQVAERKCLLSMLAAYSRQWDPRNLEAPWYEPWSQIFTDPVAVHASLSVAPQPYLWYDHALQGQQVHTTPGPQYLLSTEDEQSNDFLDEVANTTLDSVRTVSIPSHRNRCRIPDIAVTRKVSFPRPQNTSQILHLGRKVTYLGLPLLVELKPSGARCSDISTSLCNAAMPMSLARDQVTKQALHLFQMYPHQDSIILVAITGFWWSYMVFRRSQADGMVIVDEEEEEENEQQEEPDPTLRDQNGVHPDLMQDPLRLEEQPIEVMQEQLYGFSLSALDNVHQRGSRLPLPHFHKVLPQDRMKLLEGTWSKFLLYGTAPSNQVLSLMLDRLHSVVHVEYDGRMG